MIVGVAIQVLRAFVPGVEMPADFASQINTLVDILFAVVPIVAGWFASESRAKVKALSGMVE
jgi:hypothetical protein